MPEIVVKLGTKVMDTHALCQDVIKIGRGRDNDIVIDHLTVSRLHAEIRYEHGHWIVADLGSANGTFVNGQRVTTVPLYHADTITVGKLHLHFFDTPVEADDQRLFDSAADQTMVFAPSKQPRGCLTVVKGKQRGKEHVLEADRVTIGRSQECDFPLNDWRVAKCHAQITRRGDGFVVEDLGTWGAILVNGQPVKQAVLGEGDLIQLGGTRLSFRTLPSEMQTVTPRSASSSRSHNETLPGELGYRLAVDAALEMKEPRHGAAASTKDPTPDPDHASADAGNGAGDSHPAVAELAEDMKDFDGEVPVDLLDSERRRPEKPEPTDEAEPSALDGDFEEEGESGGQAPAESNGNGHGWLAEAAAANPEIAMWAKALQSDRPAIRRHAAKQIERLTGQPHDF